MQDLAGIIPLDKPAGMTSRQAVDRVKHKLPHRTKCGHAGTLDPFATGVLLVLVGNATKACEALMDAGKTYHATLRLGASPPSDDPETPPIACHEPPRPARSDVDAAVAGFSGTILQTPPVYSALKRGGRRAADRVRAGEKVVMEPRPVRIDRLAVAAYDWPVLEVSLDCGRGFYVRSLARDLGRVLGTGAYLTALRRTRVGPFDVAAAIDPNDLTVDRIPKLLRPVPPEPCTKRA